MDKKPFVDKEKARNYIKYSGFALQFFCLIFIMAWIGQKLDAYFETRKPLITALLVVLGAIAYFYKLYKDLTDD